MRVLLCHYHLKRALHNFLLKKVRHKQHAACRPHSIACLPRANGDVLRLASQVKSRALRVHLYGAVDNIIERCGTVGMDPAQLDHLVATELQRFCEEFKDEPRAAAYVQHIMAYYAPRKSAHSVFHALH